MRDAWIAILVAVGLLDFLCWVTRHETLTRTIVHFIPRWAVLLGGLLILWHLMFAYER